MNYWCLSALAMGFGGSKAMALDNGGCGLDLG